MTRVLIARLLSRKTRDVHFSFFFFFVSLSVRRLCTVDRRQAVQRLSRTCHVFMCPHATYLLRRYLGSDAGLLAGVTRYLYECLSCSLEISRLEVSIRGVGLTKIFSPAFCFILYLHIFRGISIDPSWRGVSTHENGTGTAL